MQKEPLKPSDFEQTIPWDSVKHNSANESLARSIMRTRVFKGDHWASAENPELSYLDYLEYRKSKGLSETGAASSEDFYELARYCKSPETAALFSKAWREILEHHERK